MVGRGDRLRRSSVDLLLLAEWLNNSNDLWPPIREASSAPSLNSFIAGLWENPNSSDLSCDLKKFQYVGLGSWPSG